MSAGGPESVPTSQDPRSKRPAKRRALTPNGQQAAELEVLFANPDREIKFPEGSVADKRRQLPPPPEIVQNVQGSSAGAGSGEFHVYKVSRRREYERLKLMDEETQKEQDDAAYEQNRDAKRKKDDDKTRKNREKREKAKKRKGKAPTTGPSVPEAHNTLASNGGPSTRVLKPLPRLDEEQHAQPAEATEAAEADADSSAEPDENGITIHDDD